MLELYQFAISHFCGKARWALDYKHIDYRVKNLMPGSHALKVKRIAPASSVPVLKHAVSKSQVSVIQGSGEIISYLDKNFNEFSLTPENPEDRLAALQWENYLDREIGVHVRLVCYHYYLQHKQLIVPLLTYGTPWYNRYLLDIGFGRLEKIMRKYMNINAVTANKSKARITRAVDRVDKELATRKFLVGSQFSRADLTAAALLAPLLQPADYGDVPEPAWVPDELTAFTKNLEAKLGWANDFFHDYRGRADLV